VCIFLVGRKSRRKYKSILFLMTFLEKLSKMRRLFLMIFFEKAVENKNFLIFDGFSSSLFIFDGIRIFLFLTVFLLASLFLTVFTT
jgi:hypothetical protein